MAPKINSNASFLHQVYKGPAKLRKHLIARANTNQVKTLCECALNACNSRVRVKPTQLKLLRANEGKLLRLAYVKEPIQVKKEILLQSGGALPILAALGLSALGSLIPSLLGR
jgi:hypothetical protein